MDEATYFKRVNEVEKAVKLVLALGKQLEAALKSLDVSAIERLAFPDVRSLLAEMQKTTPPAGVNKAHHVALVAILQDLEGIRTERPRLASAVRASIRASHRIGQLYERTGGRLRSIADIAREEVGDGSTRH